MKFSEKLKQAMQQLGVNQAQVVGMTGKSKGSISMYLNDKTVPSEQVQKEHSIYIEGYTQKVKYAEQQIMQTKHRISQIQTGVKNARFLRDSHRKNTKVWKNRNADVKKYRERLKEPRATLKEQNEELRNLKNLLWQRQKAFDGNVRNKEFYKKVMQEIT